MSPRSGLPYPLLKSPLALQGRAGGRGRKRERRKCFSSSIGNNNIGGPGCAGKRGAAWGLEKVPLQEVLLTCHKERTERCWKLREGKTQAWHCSHLGLCPSSPSS